MDLIEKQLATRESSFSYESNRGLINTTTNVAFPTKYRHKHDQIGLCSSTGAGGVSGEQLFSAPFNSHSSGEVQAEFDSYNDASSGRYQCGACAVPIIVPFIGSNNYHLPIFYYAERGLTKYIWPGSTDCDYEGLPVIAYSYQYSLDSQGEGFVIDSATLTKMNNLK